MTRVLSIPGSHPYVDLCLSGHALTTAGSPVGIPSPALDPAWLAAHRHEFDTVHLHFGFEHLGVAGLKDWLETAAALDLPVVFTVHDLRNPHQLDRRPHDRQLDLLMDSAAAVLTLTDAAAAEIRHRWSRVAQVVEHPYVVPPHQRPPATPAGARTGRIVGLNLKSLRRNIIEPDRVVSAVLEGASEAGGRLRVDVQAGGFERYGELDGTRRLAAEGRLDLHVHPRFTDAELAQYLTDLDVLVLPYRFGTHSGMLEACRDVGTRVVAPNCGCYREQWDDVIEYRSDERIGLDERSLSAAVAEALRRRPPAPVDATSRDGQLAVVRRVHARVHIEAASRSRFPAGLEVTV